MIEFDKKGLPTSAFIVGNALMITTDDSLPTVDINKDIAPVDAGSYKIVPWYEDNDFPQQADISIAKTPVLLRAISDLTKVTLGQGLYACKVKAIRNDGREELEVINDPEINNLLRGYIVRRYSAKTAYDNNAFGNAFVQLIPKKTGDTISKLIPVNALHCRLEYPDANGKINNVIVSGKYPDADKKSTKAYPLLDENDPFSHLMQLKDNGELAKGSVFMHIKSSFSSNDFYSLPPWFSARDWLPISQKVPKIINAGMDNMLNVFIVVKIPYEYWERKYPAEDFDNNEERRKKIENDIKEMEEKFTSVENTRKTLITHFDGEADGKNAWSIELIEPKFSKENFVSSTASDTQIAIAAGYSPDLLGLMYGNSKGGSMQRELLLLQYALSWEARQQIAEPLEMALRFNYPELNDLQLRFKNTFLTTLDTGAGTSTTLS